MAERRGAKKTDLRPPLASEHAALRRFRKRRHPLPCVNASSTPSVRGFGVGFLCVAYRRQGRGAVAAMPRFTRKFLRQRRGIQPKDVKKYSRSPNHRTPACRHPAIGRAAPDRTPRSAA